MGFCEAASITVPDTEGETYVVVSMQPLSEIRNGRATAYRHVLICALTVKVSGRAKAHPAPRDRLPHFPAPCKDCYAPHRAVDQSSNLHDTAPSRCRIRAPTSAEGGKFAAFTAIVLLRCRPRYM